MPKRRVPDVVHESKSFHQINVQAKLGGNGTRNLRDFQSVRKPVAKMVGVAPGKNLRLRFQAAKRPRMNDAVAVTLKVVAIRMRGLRIAAAARVLHSVE